MGLDFSHGGGCLWSYSRYAAFVERVAEQAKRQPWLAGTVDPIQVLLDHSCCDGHIEPHQCGPLADRLLTLHKVEPRELANVPAGFLLQGLESELLKGQQLTLLAG